MLLRALKLNKRLSYRRGREPRTALCPVMIDSTFFSDTDAFVKTQVSRHETSETIMDRLRVETRLRYC